MTTCPVCDFREDTVKEQLARIDALEVLVTLACAFAERVCDLTANPTKSGAWLRTARSWQDTGSRADQAEQRAKAAMHRAQLCASGDVPRPETWAADATWSACSCAAIAKTYIGRDLTEALKTVRPWAQKAAQQAAIATGQAARERVEQLALIRQHACTCPSILTCHNPADPRLRTSLLAN